MCVCLCLCNGATVCCLYKHFARYNTLRHILRSWFCILNNGSNSSQQLWFKRYTALWHSQSMTCGYVCAWRHCVELSAFLPFSLFISLRWFPFFFLSHSFSYVESHLYMCLQFSATDYCDQMFNVHALWLNDFYDMHWTNFGFSFPSHWHALSYSPKPT